MLDEFLGMYDHPLWPILVVIVSTFALEDLAIMGAALLVVAEKMAPGTAFVAVCVGMFIGDTALYLLGRLALVWPWLRRKARHPMIHNQVMPLRRSPWQQLMLIRCMPGIRTFGYMACGIARVPLVPFCLANLLSIIAWAAALFYATLFLGKQFSEELHEYMWLLLPLAIVLFIYCQRKIRQRMETPA